MPVAMPGGVVSLIAAVQAVTALPVTKSGPLPLPAAGTAQLVIFRPPGFLGLALGCTVMSGERELARLGPGRFRVIDLPAGRLELAAREAAVPLRLQLHAGRRTFVQCSYGRGVTRGAPDVAVVDDEVFATKAARLKLAVARTE